MTAVLRYAALLAFLALPVACADSPTTASALLPQPSVSQPSRPDTQARVSGSVTDEGGMPIAGASISASPAISTVTDAAGFYELSGLYRDPWGLHSSRDAGAMRRTISGWILRRKLSMIFDCGVSCKLLRGKLLP